VISFLGLTGLSRARGIDEKKWWGEYWKINSEDNNSPGCGKRRNAGDSWQAERTAARRAVSARWFWLFAMRKQFS
jgi:hypothetical protein